MTGPLSKVFFFRPRVTTVDPATEEGSGVTEVRIDIASQDIQAESRKMKAFRFHGDEGANIDGAVGELLTEVTQEILGTILNGIPDSSMTTIDESVDLKLQLTRAAVAVHRLTQRAPANRVIGNKKMLKRIGVDVSEIDEERKGPREVCTLDGRWRVYLDDNFPEGKLMSWYVGGSVLDTGLVYSPYIPVEITPNFVDPNDNTLRRAMRTRHKITLIRPEFAHLLQTEEPVSDKAGGPDGEENDQGE